MIEMVVVSGLTRRRMIVLLSTSATLLLVSSVLVTFVVRIACGVFGVCLSGGRFRRKIDAQEDCGS